MEKIMTLSNGMVLSRKTAEDLKASIPPADITPGAYWTKDGRPARVKKSMNDRLYAMGMNTATGKYEYERSLIYNLGERMTLESAREWGARYRRCANCGKELTDNVSVDAGMGPRCRAKLQAQNIPADQLNWIGLRGRI